MTPEQIEELERLHAEATEGPWLVKWMQYGDAPKSYGLCHADTDDIGMTEANAHMLAAARNALPELLAMARELDGFKKEQTIQLEEMRAAGPKWIAQEMVVGLLASVKFVLDGYDAPNYVETKCMDSDGQLYAVRFQRCEQASPHDLRLKAEADLLATRRALAKARAAWWMQREIAYSLRVPSSDLDSLDSFWDRVEAVRMLRAVRLCRYYARKFEAEAERTDQ